MLRPYPNLLRVVDMTRAVLYGKYPNRMTVQPAPTVEHFESVTNGDT